MIAWAPPDEAPAGPPDRPSQPRPTKQSRPVQRLPVIGQSFAHSAVEAVQRAAFEAAGLPIEIERWERRPHQLADAR